MSGTSVPPVSAHGSRLSALLPVSPLPSLPAGSPEPRREVKLLHCSHLSRNGSRLAKAGAAGIADLDRLGLIERVPEAADHPTATLPELPAKEGDKDWNVPHY